MLTRFWGARLQEEDRVVVIRFGHDYDETCMQMDEVRCRRRRRGWRPRRCGPRLLAAPLLLACNCGHPSRRVPFLVPVHACRLLPCAGAACPDALSTLLPSHLHSALPPRPHRLSPLSPSGRSWRALRSA